MLPYIDSDMPDWPVKAEQLASHYTAVTHLTGMAAASDALAETFPLYTEHPEALTLARQSKALLGKLERNQATLARRGIRFGRSRLAVRAEAGGEKPGCSYCGMCMYGCPYGIIYSSVETVRQLQKNPRFSYQPDIIVERIDETSAQAIIHGRDRINRQPLVIHGTRTFLAAGPLASTRILLESMGAYDRQVFIKDSQYWLVPMLMARRIPGVRNEALHTLSQLFMEINDHYITPFTVHLQLYAYNELIGNALKSSLGIIDRTAGFVTRELENRLMVAQGYLHSDSSSSIGVRLTRDGRLVMAPEINRGTKATILRVLAKLLKSSPSLGMAPLLPMLQVSEPGRGYHSGGSFPMRKSPAADLETDVLGRPTGRTRLHVVDSTVFPSIPATTITFTAMANAHRIGWNAAELPP